MQKMFGDLKAYQDFPKFVNVPEGRISSILNAVYGQTGYRWFDSIDYEIEENTVIFQGTHRLGNHFTQFFRHHLSNNMEVFSYELQSMSASYELTKDGTQVDHVQLTFALKSTN